jgi:hypothetical protein
LLRRRGRGRCKREGCIRHHCLAETATWCVRDIQHGRWT